MLKENQRILEGQEALEFYKKLEEEGLILYECIVGSQAYGTALPSSDVDKKFIYIEPFDRILNQTYTIQLNVTKDYVGFEIGRYLQLLKSQNPNLHEILWQDDETVLTCTLGFQGFIKNRRRSFLTKEIGNTFGKYAEAQIKKARGTNKMIVQTADNQWSERKTPLDFCFIQSKQGVVTVSEWLSEKGLKQEFCGVTNLPHSKEGHGLYYDWAAHARVFKEYNLAAEVFMGTYSIEVYYPSIYTFAQQLKNLQKEEPAKYKGIIRNDDSNDLSLSSIPKSARPIATMLYNVDAYQHHCKEYKRVKNCEANRNEERYQNNLANGAQYDAKNMMHCHRLLDMCIETLTTGDVTVKRPNREELLEIRAGKYPFEQLLADADKKIDKINELLLTTSLPETLDDQVLEKILFDLRVRYYKHIWHRYE